MEKIIENAVEASSEQVCPLVKSLPIILPALVLLGIGLTGLKIWKRRKAKKAETIEVETDPIKEG